MAEGLGVPLVAEPGLREANIGEAEGLYWPEVKSRFGETLTERWFTDDDAAFPGGETGLETRSRGSPPAPARPPTLSADRRLGPWRHGATADEACVAAGEPAGEGPQYRAICAQIRPRRQPPRPRRIVLKMGAPPSGRRLKPCRGDPAAVPRLHLTCAGGGATRHLSALRGAR
jgi:hypothetical protein